MDELDPDQHSLVMPFTVVASRGGPYDDVAFVAGYTTAQWWFVLERRPERFTSYVYPDLVAQIDLVAMHHGYQLIAEPYDETWTRVEARRVD